jgi:hypothetical protein
MRRKFAAARFAIGLFAIVLCGCAASSPPAGAVSATKPFDPTGSWEGTLKAGCLHFRPMMVNTRCSAVNNIALTMVDEPSGISGFYKCSIGTMECRNQNDSGKFADGSMTGTHLALRIAMEDGSSCLFDGNTIGANRIEGYYACYQGGGLEERGSFQIRRNY